MSGPTKAQLQVSLTMARADAAEVRAGWDHAMRLLGEATSERDQAVKERDEARHGWTQAQASADEQFRHTREMRERAELAESTLKETLDELVRQAAQLDAERATRSRVEGDLRKQLADAQTALTVASVDLADARDDLRDWQFAHGAQLKKSEKQLARAVQTSHDREAGLTDAMAAIIRGFAQAAVARSKP